MKIRLGTALGALFSAATVLIALLVAPSGLASASSTDSCAYPNYRGTVYGTSMNSAPDDYNRWSGWIGKPECNARVYFPGAPPANWSDNAVLANQPANGRVVFSFKSGSPSQITAFEKTRPAATKCWATFYHEPENNKQWQGASGEAAYRAAWADYGPAIRAGGCIPTLILMRYTLQAASGRDWHTWYNASAVDVIAWDAYNSAHDAKPPSYESPSTMLGPIEQVATETGKPWGLGETGSPIIAGDTNGAQRCSWTAELRSAVKADGRANFALWWDQGAGTSFDNTADACVAQHWGA